MASESRHVSVPISRSADEVYAYASDPVHLPEWAAGLAGAVEQVDGQWVADSPMGRIVVAFVPPNAFGVLDHYVTVPSGQTFYNPMRVIADGSECEVVFTVRRTPEMSDADFDRDAATVLADLTALKQLLER